MEKIELVVCSVCKREVTMSTTNYHIWCHCGVTGQYARSEIEAALAWNALHAPRQQWILCSERMPTRKDANDQEDVWWAYKYLEEEEISYINDSFSWNPEISILIAWMSILPLPVDSDGGK